MKELSIEEKAKRYDEIIKKANKMHHENCEACQMCIEELIPELVESEDEKIRKEILEYFTKYGNFELRGIDISHWIAWLEKQGGINKLSEEEQNTFAKGVQTSCALSFIDYLDANKYDGKMCMSNGECEDIENAFHNAMWDRLHRYYCKYIEKQGEQKSYASKTMNEKGDFDNGFTRMMEKEQKPADKIEPKFKAGDWVVIDGETMQIESVGYNVYNMKDGGIIPFRFEQEIRLWTINDAKDGDVLAYNNWQWIFIFKAFGEEENETAYHALLSEKGLTLDDYHYSVLQCAFSPATKEQRDTLMKAIKKAGYEWDAEKKELKKIDSQRMISAEAKEALLEDSSRYNKHCETCSVKTNLCNPNVCEIIKCMKSAKPTIASSVKEEPELTEFEKEIEKLLITYGKPPYATKEDIKMLCPHLLDVARNQIASEIDLYAMEKDFMDNNEESKTHFASYFYKMGIEDTLKAIKKGE